MLSIDLHPGAMHDGAALVLGVHEKLPEGPERLSL
jgi:hypothetical protein